MSSIPRLELEARTALTIAEAMAQTVALIEQYWPQSKRGSNAQREWTRLKEQRETILLCLNDGLAKEGVLDAQHAERTRAEIERIREALESAEKFIVGITNNDYGWHLDEAEMRAALAKVRAALGREGTP